jgi:hypothetical protein
MFMNSNAQPLEPTPDEVDADLRHAKTNDGRVFVAHRPEGCVSLYTVDGGRVRWAGTFDNPGSAWALLDELEETA